MLFNGPRIFHHHMDPYSFFSRDLPAPSPHPSPREPPTTGNKLQIASCWLDSVIRILNPVVEQCNTAADKANNELLLSAAPSRPVLQINSAEQLGAIQCMRSGTRRSLPVFPKLQKPACIVGQERCFVSVLVLY